MDDNWNPRNNQSDDDQWDRWDSNASNSSYYNQPVHKPYGRGFSNAAFLLGALSVTVGCGGISLPLGALGILFALLVYRKGRKLNSTAKSGLVLSCIGAVLGLWTIYIQFTMPNMLQRLQEIGAQNLSKATYGSEYDGDSGFTERSYNFLRIRHGNPVEE